MDNSALSIRVLGPVEVFAGTSWQQITAPRQRAALAVLAMNRRALVRAYVSVTVLHGRPRVTIDANGVEYPVNVLTLDRWNGRERVQVRLLDVAVPERGHA